MATSDRPATRAPNPWHVGVVCGMASYIDASAIVATGIALVMYQQTIGITSGQIGVMSGALTMCIAAGALVGGRLGDRVGRRRVFLVTMALIACGATLLTLGATFPVLLVGVVLVGLGTGADLPVSLATISEACTEANRGAILGLSNILWQAGIVVTIGISSVAGGWGRLGGQLLFGHVGVMALVLLVVRLSIPESSSWLRARDERIRGVATIRAEHTSYRDLLRGPYLALVLFYALTNVAANTTGQFGTYLAVNVAGLPVEVFARVSLIGLPVGVLGGLWFMRIVDTPRRMTYFVVGGAFLVAGYLLPAVAGFTLVTIALMNVLVGFGGAFAFEGIMKVWTQESFPTMVRSSAQGVIVAVARVVAALVAFGTPALVEQNARGLYGGLAGVVAVGLVIGWLGFRRTRRSAFDVEHEVTTGDDTRLPVATASTT